MFGKIAAFELRYQLKNPVFWVVSVLFFLLTFGAMTIDGIQIGSGGNVNANSPLAIVQIPPPPLSPMLSCAMMKAVSDRWSG